MLRNFEAFQLAKQYYLLCKRVRLPKHLHDQITRASSSIALNLAEGSAKPSVKDRKRYYAIALGSLRECEAVLELEEAVSKDLLELTDRLGAMLYKLSRQ